MEKKYQELLTRMQEKGYPVSVQSTAIGAIKFSKDKESATARVEDFLRQNLTAREMVKALQPLLSEN